MHGDDFASTGELADLQWMDQALGNIFLVKTEILGPHKGLKTEVRVLSRLISWRDGHGLVSGGGGSPGEDWLHGLVDILHL